MGIGILAVWRRTFQLGKAMFPFRSRHSYRHRVALALVVLFHFSRVRAWFEQDDNPWLCLARKRYPLIDAAIYLPYMNRHWRLDQRLYAIDLHYRLLKGRAEVLARALTQAVELARFDEEWPGLRLVLDRAPWMLFEGEAVLNLFIDDVRYYSLTFSLGLDADEPVILVGALQGVKAESARDTYRALTYALHRIRPRDLLVVALQLLAAQFGVRRICAISNDARQCCSAFYGKSRKAVIHADFDQIWGEHGGWRRDNGFFEIPAELRCRPLSEVHRSKRSSYRRRYRMLDRVAAEMKAACAADVEVRDEEEAGAVLTVPRAA